MRRRFQRSVLSLLLLVCFAPSLAICGEINLIGQLVELHSVEATREETNPWQYTPIVPPATTGEFLSQATEQTTYLGDLPIDQVMARDLINKLLGAFLIEMNDEIATLLRAFGINLPDNWATIPLNYLLDLIKLKSYEEKVATELLASWSAGELSEAQEATLKRFWIAQMSVRTGFDSALAMAEDASEGLYDLIDLVYGATNVLKKVGDKFENLPIVGAVIKKIRLMISQRIIFALNNGVDLITSKMKEPARSRVRGIATALTTTYIKWAGIQVGEGFGGISSELLQKIGAKLLGKFLLILPPKIGFVSMTSGPAKLAQQKAQATTCTGEFADAAAAVLDDGNETAETAVLEVMKKTVLRKQKLSFQERQIANVAGAISQIAQLVHFVDPTSFARIVAIGAGILAGGLQLHTVFNSGITLYRIPGQVDQAVKLAFDPATSSGDSNPGGLDESQIYKAPPEFIHELQGRLTAAAGAFGDSIDELKAAVGTTDIPRIDAALGGVEKASTKVRREIKSMSQFVVDSDGGPDVMRSLFGEGMMNHDLKSAGVYADTLAYVYRPSASQRPALIEKIEGLRKQTGDFLASVSEVAATGRIIKGAALSAVVPSVTFATNEIEITASVLSVGTQTVRNVRAKLGLPKGYLLASGTQVQKAESLAPGQELTVKWVIKKPAGEFRRSMVVVNIDSQDAPEVNQSVLVTE